MLGALAQVSSEEKLDLAGVVDQTQLRGVVYEWSRNGNIFWKLPLLQRALAEGFTGKRSQAWRPDGGIHDFMHAKVTVADDTLFVGSYNLSRSGEMNAENVLEIESAELAERRRGVRRRDSRALSGGRARARASRLTHAFDQYHEPADELSAGDAHLRADLRVADRGGRGDRLVRAAALAREGRRGEGDHE